MSTPAHNLAPSSAGRERRRSLVSVEDLPTSPQLPHVRIVDGTEQRVRPDGEVTHETTSDPIQVTVPTREEMQQDLEGVELRRRLKFFFMNPVEKWIARRQTPWKLGLQVIKIIIVTAQLIKFGQIRMSHINYMDSSNTVFRHLFLKGWDFSRDIMSYPPPNGPLAVYTKEDFYDSLTNAVQAYYLYDIGDPLGKGCNACVYAARIRSGDAAQLRVPEVPSVYQPPAAEEPYNLAIKMMFNYSFGSRLTDIIEACKQELVPSTAPSVRGMIKWDKTISRSHPNVINIRAAFGDRVRLFADSIVEYPQALPARLYAEGLGWDQTLFIVMSRYKMTLRQYILTHEYGSHTGQVLYGQLLEAIRFLVEEKIAHRDMKSNNILIEFNRTSEIPLLVISDFGCCLANDSMKLSYFDEDTDLGGNLALRPPEISCAQPGFLSFLDYSRADLWASGAIAYEIFTRCNPFYKRTVNSKTYREADLPELPDNIPCPVRRVVQQILSRKPEKRPSPECAASVMALSCLDRKIFTSVIESGQSSAFAHLKSHFTEEEMAKHLRVLQSGKRLDNNYVCKPIGFLDRLSDVMSLYSAETMMGRVSGVLSRSEVIVRTSFLSRLDSRVLLDAVEYFL